MDAALDIERRYWTKLEDMLRSSFGECAIHVRQCLQQDLPKLLAAARGLQAKFGTTFVFGPNVFAVLEAGYLEQCAVNLKASLVGTDCPKPVRLCLLGFKIVFFLRISCVCVCV